MADFWGGFAQGFAPSYESATARRIRAEERAEDRKYADDIRDKQRKQNIEDRILRNEREDAQLRIKMAHELQKLEDAERRGDAKQVEAAKVIIQSLDEEIRKKVQPQAPPLLGGPAMGGAGQPPRAIPRDIDAAMPSVMPGEIQGRVPPPAAAPVRPPERVAGGLPVPKEFEGSPEIMESIRKDLEAERGEVSDAAMLGAAVRGQRMQTLAEGLKKEKQQYRTQAERAFEYLKDIQTADSPTYDFLSQFDAGLEWIDAVNNMELEEGVRKPRISDTTALQFADMIKASVSEFSKPTKTTAPTLHARKEELVKIINNPDSTPPEKAEAQKILDVLKPPAAGSAPTAWQAQEGYVKTINDPDATPDEKNFAQQMLDRTGGQVITVTDPETGIVTLQVGRAGAAGAKPPEPDKMAIAQLLLSKLKEGFNPDNPQVGWIATAKNALFDKVATQAMVTAWADPDRVAYRQLVNEFQVKYVLALNAPDYRLSDNDRKILLPLAPSVNDSPFMFEKKLGAIDRKLGLLTKFHDAYKGKKDIWGMSLKEVMNARKPKGQGGIPGMNDELAAFILSEKHGLQGFSDPDNPDLSGDEVTQIRERNAKAVTDFQENVRRLQESGDITDNEAFFLYRSVFKNPNR
jgi:hypothetical protein